MRFLLRTTLAALLAAVLVAVSGIPATAATGSPRKTGDAFPKVKTSLKPGDGYVISDPRLMKDPQRIMQTMRSDGDLDRLGLKPTSDPSAARQKAEPRAASDRSYTIPSQRYPRGRKPADPYRYIKSVGECYAQDDAHEDSGWIKNRFSYCQEHWIVQPAVKCGILPPGCYLRGWFISSNTLNGKGKIGGHKGDRRTRWADFSLDTVVISATGDFNQSGARMKARMNCRGTWQGGGGSARRACSPGDHQGRTASIPSWRRNGHTHLDLVSTANSAPNAAAGEQIAHGVFQPVYEFTIPGYSQAIPTSGEVGRLRFDSAWYLRRGKLGSVFDDATPALRFDRSDRTDASRDYLGVAKVADHIGDAQTRPSETLPPKTSKHLPGAEPADPMHRLVPGAGAEQRKRRNANRSESTGYCDSGKVPGAGKDKDCDEYPMAATYEGAARHTYENDERYKNDYSVRYIARDDNQEAGRRQYAWSENDRLLDGDPFIIEIGN